ncbi:helix-turn-helix domain-containing protein [Methylopila sp. M107]|uniref:helix-turn-helix domain-containing protein n=1 Tax=Methylopila sp. M107 TaxID=1101190 RepID=UPI0004784FC5|nr:helix-turn-helix domain-containing protein [Methylopila sp. M107]
MSRGKRRPRWDRHAIRAAVHRAGSTLSAVAREAGLEGSACRVALNRRHPAGEAALAQFLNVSPQILWPGRYPSKPASPSGSNQESTSAPSPIGEAL